MVVRTNPIPNSYHSISSHFGIRLKGVPVQDVCLRSCLPIWAVMFVCLCACPLVCLASVGIATANANVLFWETL